MRDVSARALLAVVLSSSATAYADAGSAIETARTQIEAILRESRIPGVALALVDAHGLMWSGGVGMADPSLHRAATPDVPFRAASIAKSFIAVTVMRLVEAGQLSLDAHVRDLAPEIEIVNAWEATHPVRVRDLLQHTAGFDDCHPGELVNDGDPEVPLREVLARHADARVARWAPGTRYAYSCHGFTLAAYLIEKITGEPYEAIVEREVLSPLGLGATSLVMTDTLCLELAQGHRSEGTVPVPVPYWELLHRPAGRLFTTADDLARFTRMWIGRGAVDGTRLLRQESIATMEESDAPGLAGLPAAYGLGNGGELTDRLLARGHEGWSLGFQGEYRYVPALGVGWVILMNASPPSDDPLERIRSVLVGLLTPEHPRPAPPPVTPADDAVVGDWSRTNPRRAAFAFQDTLAGGATVAARRGRLLFEPWIGSARVLVGVGPGEYRFEDDAATRFVVGRDEAGIPTLVSAGAAYRRSPAWWRWATWGGLLTVLVALGSSILATPLLARRAARGRELSVVLLPALAALAFVVLVVALVAPVPLREPSVAERVGFVAGIAFAVSSVAGALRAGWAIRRGGLTLLRAYAAAAALAGCALAIVLTAWGVLGLPMWQR